MRRPTDRITTWIFWVYLGIFIAVHAAYGVHTAFMPAENDIFGIISVARGLKLMDWSSFHNEFFGAGLPLIIALLPQQHALPIISLLALLGSAATLVATFSLVTQIAGRLWAFPAVVLTSTTPLFVDYAASAGPDAIATGMCMIAFAWLVRETSKRSEARSWVLIGTGVLSGMAGIVRYNVLLLGVGLIVYAALSARPGRRLRAPLLAAAGICAGFLPQVILNLLGGYGPLEIGSAFYVYESALGVNWFDTASIPPENYSSVARVVLDNPRDVVINYLLTLTNYVIPIAALTVAIALRSARQQRIALIALLAATTVYALIVSVASSPRGPIATLPVTAIGLGCVAQSVTMSLPATLGRAKILIGCLAILVVVWPLLREDLFILQAKATRAAERAAVEAELISRGDITDASHILTNDFDLYFTSIPGVLPDRIGGWQDISLNGERTHVTVDLSSVVAFYCDASRRGLSTVLWRESQLAFMDGALSGALNGGSTNSRLLNEGQVGPYELTRLSSEQLC